MNEQEKSNVLGPTSGTNASCLGCTSVLVVLALLAAGSYKFGKYLQLEHGFSLGWALVIGLTTFISSTLIVVVIYSFIAARGEPARIIGVTGLLSGVEEHGEEPEQGIPGSVSAFDDGSILISIDGQPEKRLQLGRRLQTSITVFEPHDEDDNDENEHCLYISDRSGKILVGCEGFSYSEHSYPCLAVTMNAKDGKEAFNIINAADRESVKYSDEQDNFTHEVTPWTPAERTANRTPPPEPKRRFITNLRTAEELVADWIVWMGWQDTYISVTTIDNGVSVLGVSFEAGTVVAKVEFKESPTEQSALENLLNASVDRESDHCMFFSASSYTNQAIAWADDTEIPLFHFSHDGQMQPVNANAAAFFNKYFHDDE